MKDWIGATVTVHDNPAGGENPPIILGYLGSDSSKPTLLVYGHLDVQPADPDDWNTDPFVLTRIGTTFEDTNLYGRGSTDDKGPVLAWLNVIEAYQDLKMNIPVNIKVRGNKNFAHLEQKTGISIQYKHISIQIWYANPKLFNIKSSMQKLFTCFFFILVLFRS